MAAAAGVGLSHYFFSGLRTRPADDGSPNKRGIMAAMHFRWVCRRCWIQRAPRCFNARTAAIQHPTVLVSWKLQAHWMQNVGALCKGLGTYGSGGSILSWKSLKVKEVRVR